MVHFQFLMSLSCNGERIVGTDNLFQKKRMRDAQELSRQKSKRAPYEIVHIICEGETECAYIKKLIQFFRLNAANVTVAKGQGSAPISIVDEGFELARTKSGIDRIVYVFDRDNHESYNRAIKKVTEYKSKRNDKSKPIYTTIISVPCFEVWLLLHFNLTTKAYTKSGKKTPADNVITDLHRDILGYQKIVDITEWFDQVLPRIEMAIKHAELLAEHNKKTNSINPSTNIHELIFLFKDLKK